MLSKLTEVYTLTNFNRKNTTEYGLREIYINPKSISMIREEPNMKRYLSEGKLPEGIDNRVEFSRVSINAPNHSSSIVVVGAPHTIQEKLKQARQVLKG